MRRKTNRLLEEYLNLLILEKIEELNLNTIKKKGAEKEEKEQEDKRDKTLKLEGELSVMNQLLIINDYYLFNLLERQKKAKVESYLKLSKKLNYPKLTEYLETFLSKNILTNQFKSLNTNNNNAEIEFKLT